MTSAERIRVDSFRHPEDGLVEATPWYRRRHHPVRRF